MSQELVDKGVRVFKFLAKAQELKHKPVVDLRSYGNAEDITWLSSLPASPGVRWSAPEEGVLSFLEVDRLAAKPAPEIPLDLAGSVDGDPSDPSTDLRLQGPGDEIDDEEAARIENLFLGWKGTWQAWATKEREERPVRDLYARLFRIHLRGEQQSEEMQLVLGTGLLQWLPADSREIRRHVVTAEVTSSLDERNGTLTFSLDEAEAPVRVELDMLDPSQIQDKGLVTQIENDAAGMGPSPLDEGVQGLLTGFANRLHEKAWFDASTEMGQALPTPCVRWAPAMMLRPRNQAGLIKALRQIASQIEEQQSVPAGLLPLVDPDYQPEPVANPAPGALLSIDESVVAPLPLNDQQRRILRHVETYAQTVVQGPPGTGKTHMAAALISHLVAQGKRVLVTAQTDRALYEVRDKLPGDIQPLVVSVMSGTQKDIADLQTAVREIARRSESYDPEGNAHAIDQALARVEELRGERQMLNRTLVEAREAEVQEVDFEGQSASLATFAKEYAQQAPGFAWADSLLEERSHTAAPLTADEAAEWLALLRDGELEALSLTELGCIDPSDLPQAFEFAQLVEREAIAQRQLESAAGNHAQLEPDFSPELSVQLRSVVRQCLADIDALLQVGEAWTGNAVHDVLAGSAEVWVGRAQQLHHGLRSIEELNGAVPFGTRITVGEDADRLVPMAESLLAHVRGAGKLKVGADGVPRFTMLTPRVVKDCRPFFEEVLVNGVPATSEASLTIFISHTHAWRQLGELDRLWPSATVIPDEDTVQERVDWHRDQVQRMDAIVAVGTSVAEVRALLASHGIHVGDWNDRQQLLDLLNALDEVVLRRDLAEAQAPLDALHQRLTEAALRPDASQSLLATAAAVEARSVAAYASATAEMAHLLTTNWRRGKRAALSARVRAASPRLAEAVVDDPGNGGWDARLGELDALFRWARLGSWILSWELDDVNSLQARLAVIEAQLTSLSGRIAALRAWGHAVSPRRLTQGARADLASYADLVKKLGKGTGKYAAQRRAEIRQAMERCRPAVPVWVMPIYRIADQFQMQENMFDVVIVDEASQAGLEATFLQYLAPSIVVIGDDRQVSPSNVGIDEQQLRDLATQYLYDDRYRPNWQDPKRSLFDEARMRYKGQLTLVEHRRCYPEIIEFSNRIAYANNGVSLIPVRQFGADRLDPFVNRFVARGNNPEGRNVNRPEAEALVADLLECLADPAYAGKTMAVISLVGADQAKLVQGALLDAVPSDEWSRRDLRVGIAPDFQGAERDVIFLSMVTAPEPGRRLASLSGEQYIQRFNVAVSRARDQVRLFHSIKAVDIPREEDVRRQLLEYAYEVASRGRALSEPLSLMVDESARDDRFDSLFEQRVFNRIVERGYNVRSQVEEQGYRIDLVVVGSSSRLAVECDGDFWHGPAEYARDLARQRELERCGWHFFRVRESAFYVDPGAALSPLWKALESHGIHPYTPELVSDELDELVDAGEESSPDVALEGPAPAVSDQPAPIESPPAAEPVSQPRRALAPNSWRLDVNPAILGFSAERAVDEAVVSTGRGTQAGEGDLGGDDLIQVAPYVPFDGATTPLSVASLQQMVEGLVAIVEAEGPVTVSRVRQAYVQASGGQRVGKEIARQLDRAVKVGLRRGEIEADPAPRTVEFKDWTLRLDAGVPDRVRTPGPRDLDQIPGSELDELVHWVADSYATEDAEELMRGALRALGKTSLTGRARAALEPSVTRLRNASASSGVLPTLSSGSGTPVG